MADGTPIEWTDATWQIVTGCSVVSPGCTNCYAMKLAGTRLRDHPSRADLTIASKAGPVWNGQVRFNEVWLTQPLRWKKPRRIFVAAHGDLFHDGVEDGWLDRIFAVMALCPQHTFQVLTKRPERMRAYLSDPQVRSRIGALLVKAMESALHGYRAPPSPTGAWPLPNVWLGVSAEDQTRADERIPILLDIPAAVRWLSAEPLLGPITLYPERIAAPGDALWDWQIANGIDAEAAARTGRGVGLYPAIDWVVAGGESGPSARPMHPDWVRQLRDQCAAAGIPFLFKQWGEWGLGVGDDDYRARAAEAESITLPPMHRALGPTLYRVGKKASGRLLDRVLHDAFPEVRQ